MSATPIARSFFLVLLLMGLAACGKNGGTPSSENEPPIIALVFSGQDGQTLELVKGASVTIQVYGLLANGGKIDLTDQVAWRLSPDDLVVLDGRKVRALAPGEVRLVASYAGLQAELPVKVTTSSLQYLTLQPDSTRLYAGQTRQFRLIGEFSNGQVQDLTDSAQWSLEGSGASLDPKRPGRVVADDDPQATGTLTLTAQWGEQSVQATVTRLSGELEQLVIEAPTTLRVGEQVTPTVQALFRSGNNLQAVDVTPVWVVENPSLVAVDGDTLIGLAPGSTQVQTQFGTKTTSFSLTIEPAAVESLEIEAPVARLAVGQSLSLRAWLRYTDGSRSEVTPLTTWTVTPSSRATIGNGPGDAGRLFARTEGEVEVQASIPGWNARLILQVDQATLKRLEISPAEGRLLVGGTLDLQALGHYSDGSLHDLTADVVWRVDDPTLARIETLASPRGRLIALAPGTLTVTARVGDIDATASFTLRGAEVLALSLSGAEETLSVSSSLQLRALAQLEDASEEDVTTQAQWSSSNPTVLAPDPDNPGRFLALSEGDATIGAVYTDSQGQATSAFLQVQVVQAPLSELLLHDEEGSLLEELTLASGTRIPLRIIGQYADGRQQPVSEVTLTTENPEIARIIVLGDTPWLLALGPGETKLTLTQGQVNHEVQITVTGAVLQTIEVTPTPVSLLLNAQRPLAAIGQFDDGTRQNLTQQVVWTSDDPAIARISNGRNEAGTIFGEGEGQTTVTARFGDVEGSITVTVSDDPQAIAGITLTASPNVLLDDPVELSDDSQRRDTTTLQVRLHPLGEGVQVPDDIPVTLTLTYPDGTSRSESLITKGGRAEFTLESPGELTSKDAPWDSIRVEAEVTDTRQGLTFTRRTTVWVVERLDYVLSHRVYLQPLDAEKVRFLLWGINLSNRELVFNRLGLFQGNLSEQDLQAWISGQADPDGGAQRLDDRALGEEGAGVTLLGGQGLISATNPLSGLGSDPLWLLYLVYDPALEGYFPSLLRPFTLSQTP